VRPLLQVLDGANTHRAPANSAGSVHVAQPPMEPWAAMLPVKPYSQPTLAHAHQHTNGYQQHANVTETSKHRGAAHLAAAASHACKWASRPQKLAVAGRCCLRSRALQTIKPDVSAAQVVDRCSKLPCRLHEQRCVLGAGTAHECSGAAIQDTQGHTMPGMQHYRHYSLHRLP
jgi:hypothetical protein